MVQNQAIVLGLFIPFWIGYVLTGRQTFGWDIYSEASSEQDLTSLSSTKWVICSFLVIIVGLAGDESLVTQKDTPTLMLSKVNYVLLEEAENFSVMCLSQYD